jgi:CRP-like cAMP-binding protein
VAAVTPGGAGALQVFEESRGSLFVLGTVPSGSVVGEVGFLDGRPRTRHVRAKTTADLRKITREGFLDMLDQAPVLFAKLMVAMSELLAARYRAVVEELEPVRALAASLRSQAATAQSVSATAKETLDALDRLTPKAHEDPEL